MADGCNYGKGTRWGTGVAMSIILAVTVASLSISVAAYAKVAEVADIMAMRIDRNSAEISVVREGYGRVDERLKSLATGQAEIKKLLEARR